MPLFTHCHKLESFIIVIDVNATTIRLVQCIESYYSDQYNDIDYYDWLYL